MPVKEPPTEKVVTGPSTSSAFSGPAGAAVGEEEALEDLVRPVRAEDLGGVDAVGGGEALPELGRPPVRVAGERERPHELAGALDILVRMESTHVLRATFASHGTIPVHATSVGKLLLAYRRPGDLDRLLASPLPALASGTVTDAKRLRREILQARARGVAFGVNEVEEGAAGLAGAICDQQGDLIAVLHVEGPSSRFTRQRMEEIAGFVAEKARAIEREYATLVDLQMRP